MVLIWLLRKKKTADLADLELIFCPGLLNAETVVMSLHVHKQHPSDLSALAC